MKICLVCEGISDTEQERCASCGLRLVKSSEVHFPLRRGEEDAANPLLGALIDGKYRVTNVLGKGGMGTVFRATHEVSLVPVALKVLHPRFATRPEYRDHFLAEARKAGRVVHEHSSRVLDVGEDADGTVYIAMELVEGVTLAEWIHGGDPLSPSEVVEILYQTCQALAVAHEVGLVHRDLSPRNVMGLVREGRPFVKILDFGISKGAPSIVRGVMAEALDEPAGFANPPYSAPEHLAGEEVDARADLYSLGVIAYEALTRRLPVQGRDKHELAVATIEGRLAPLRAPAGTPSRLVRLIQRLLSRHPDGRPGSAEEVQRELDRIRYPRLQVLRVVSVVALILSLTAFLVLHAERLPVYLDLQPGTALKLYSERPEPDTAAQQIPSTALDNLRFSFGGFNPTKLQVEAYTMGPVHRVGNLSPEIDYERGTMTLSRARSPAYSGFLEKLASSQSAFDLVFSTPGRPDLGYARVLVDDDPPVVSFGGSGGEGVELVGSSFLSFAITEKGALESVWITMTWGPEDNRGTRRIDLAPTSGQRAIEVLELFGADLGVEPRRDVVLRVQARDAAGHESVGADTMRLDKMDLHAPRLLQVRGSRENLVTCGPDGAWLTVELDAAESDAVLVVQSEAFTDRIALEVKDVQPVFLESRSSGPGIPFRNGRYVFWIEDFAGNTSQPLQRDLQFETEEAQARLSVVSVNGGTLHGRVLEPLQVVTDGSEVACDFACNELYQPLRITLSGNGHTDSLPLQDSSPGRGRFTLPELGEGQYELEITLEDKSGLGPLKQEYDVRVLPDPPELRFADTGDKRFLEQLGEIGLLAYDPATEWVTQGYTWLPGQERWVEGKVWFGLVNDPAPFVLRSPEDGSGLMFDGARLLPGENVLGVEIADVLGRPVGVRIGGRAAEPLEAAPGALEIARFLYYPGAVVSEVAVEDVERDQPAKVVLLAPLPFRAQDDVRLRFGSALPFSADVAPIGEHDSQLTFSVPWDVVASEAGWDEIGGTVLGPEHQRVITARLETPAGLYQVSLTFRPIRTTLTAVNWSGLSAADLPEPLRGIRMVPVLAPEGGTFRDPVSSGNPFRAEFRPMPSIDVRNVSHLFLQEAELTRAQYHALLAAFRAPAKGDRFVHAWDPAGVDRFARLRPFPFVDDEEGWEAAVAVGPDRPVTGVNFFQAYTVSRIAGHVLAGDPELFRLPMGLELELAALGAGDRRKPGALHGGDVDVAQYHKLGGLRFDVSRWPPTAEVSREAGDAVTNEQGDALVALDFGVREWVLDLPYFATDPSAGVLREWLLDHRIHIGHAIDFALRLTRPPEVLRPHLARNGVVRGVAWGDERGLLDTAGGRRSEQVRAGLIPESVPGVVRMLIVRRDGAGLLPGEPDPYLREIGFRLAGGDAFVQRVRELGR